MWDSMNATSIYGVNPATAPALAAANVTPGIAVAAGPSMLRDVAAWSPNSPIFWGAALLLVTVGAIGVAGSSSGSVRVGKGKFSVSGSAGAGKA